VVKRDADGEYLNHNTDRYRIQWTKDVLQCPAPGYAVDVEVQDLVLLDLRDVKTGEFLGTALYSGRHSGR
jgi:hypothetical protein